MFDDVSGELNSVMDQSINSDPNKYKLVCFCVSLLGAMAAGGYAIYTIIEASKKPSNAEQPVVDPTLEPTIVTPILPPDPITIAPTLDPTQITKNTVEFLYTGDNPIQTGVDPDTIDIDRVAVLRGKVVDRDNIALPGVTVNIKNHPEFGQTLSRADGAFDLVVNGGALFTTSFQKENFLAIQRKANTHWGQFTYIEDVMMISLDSQVTTIDLTSGASMQVAQGSPQTDAAGTRQMTVLFPQNTNATIVLADGSTQMPNNINVRATEYTVGSNGTEAMPGELPNTSGYTYAVELSIDEAITANATRVEFNQSLPIYVDNFLNFSAGEVVPIGWYDQNQNAWVPSPNGRVIEILNIINGLAQIDIDGSGAPANASELAKLGITDAELNKLASIYAPGATIWRVSMNHFTPWDCNWPYGPPSGAGGPSGASGPQSDSDADPNDNDDCEGCIIEPQSQTLSEKISIIGAPFSLHYRSDRAAGRINAVEITLSTDTVSADLQAIELTINVAGRTIKETFPALPNQVTTFIWDRLDAYNRSINDATARIIIDYVYPLVYYQAREDFEASFGQFGDTTSIVGIRNDQVVRIRQEWTHTFSSNVLIANVAKLGSWSLTAHHAFDPISNTLYKGDGNRHTVESTGFYVDTVWTDCGDDGTMLGDQLATGLPFSFTIGPDGNTYLFDTVSTPHAILKVDAHSGIVSKLIEFGLEYRNFDDDIKIGPDASIYYSIKSFQNGQNQMYFGKINFDGTNNTLINQCNASSYYSWYIDSFDVDTEGNIFVAREQYHNILKISTDGSVSAIIGTGSEGLSGDGGSALDAQLAHPRDIKVGPDGILYIADTYNCRIRKVTTDGIITTIAGKDCGNYQIPEEQILATEASIGKPSSLSLGDDGTVYFNSANNVSSSSCVNENRYIGAIDNRGYFYHLLGNGDELFNGNLRNPGDTSASPYKTVWTPMGDIYFRDFYNHRIRKITSAISSNLLELDNLIVPSSSGNEIYIFDSTGRHLRSLSTTTGAIIWSFAYTDQGYLSNITDVDGRVTSIERDESDDPLAIISPDNHRTTLALNTNGYLSSITDPGGNTFNFSYTDHGLMTQKIDPRGNSNSFEYDLGRLTKDTNAVGGGWTLARTDSNDSYTVSMTTGEKRIVNFTVASLAGGGRKHINTAPDGTQTIILFGSDATKTTTSSDGTVTFLKKGPDPRFGMQAHVAEIFTVTTPSGLVYTSSEERTAVLADENDLLSHTMLSETVTVNDKIYTRTYNTTMRNWIYISAEGRQQTRILDDKGRTVEYDINGFAPIHFAYDFNGRLRNITQNDGNTLRLTQMNYYIDGAQQGFLQSLMNAENHQYYFAYNPAGHLIQVTLPDGRKINYDYDPNGNRISLTTPNDVAHYFNYTAINLQNAYIPPEVSNVNNLDTYYTYNLDKELTRVVRPDGQTVDFIYHSTTGKLTAIVSPFGNYTYNYNTATGKLNKLSTSNNVILDYIYDGFLLITKSWSGLVIGSVDKTYNNDFKIVQRCVNAGNCISFAYDDDLLLTQAGDLMIVRDSQRGGLITNTQLNNLATSRTYNNFGEQNTFNATVGSVVLYTTEYIRDKLGRIVQQTENIQGVTTIYDYSYDQAERLIEIKANDIVTASYDYDNNGNRISLNGTPVGSYDAQDRLLQYGDYIYTYSANGDLQTKTDVTLNEITQYTYDVFGNLIDVTLSDGTFIEYIIDGGNRRVAKKVNGVVVQKFLYKDSLNPIAELDINDNIQSRFIYGSKMNIPDYMIKNSITYRILSDHLGSPRLIVNTVDGSIVQRIDYDEWGNVIQDTNPGFQPFGFAGGIYDTDTKLIRFGARDYDAQVGRWTTKDPIRFDGGINLFGYVENDPVNFVDSSGNKRSLNAFASGLKALLNVLCASEKWMKGLVDKRKKEMEENSGGRGSGSGCSSDRDSGVMCSDSELRDFQSN